MPDTQTFDRTAVSTLGFQGTFYGGDRADPFGLRTDRFKEYEGKQVFHSRDFQDMTGLLDARRNQYAHSHPAFGEIEYYEIPDTPELSADIAPETPTCARMEFRDAVRDVLVTFYFQRMTAVLTGNDTQPLLPPANGPRRESCPQSGWWIVPKKKEVFELTSFLKTLFSRWKRGRLAATTSACGSMLAELQSFGNLEKGWNSYSAPAPTATAIENAKLLVTEAEASDTIPERVEPSAMGGVGVTFSSGDREVIVEFYNTGKAHALFADDSTQDMHTRPVATGDGYKQLLDKVRAYLHGQQTTAQSPRAGLPG